MESSDNLKKSDIKNCTCYYFDDIIRFEVFDLDDILLDEKSNGNILVYNISNKTLIGAKPLHIRFDKIDGFIRVYDRTRVYDVTERYDLIGIKNGIMFHAALRFILCFKIDSYDSLPLGKTLTFHNVIIYSLSQFLIKIKITTTVIYS